MTRGRARRFLVAQNASRLAFHVAASFSSQNDNALSPALTAAYFVFQSFLRLLLKEAHPLAELSAVTSESVTKHL